MMSSRGPGSSQMNDAAISENDSKDPSRIARFLAASRILAILSYRAAMRFVKNCVKPFIGRKRTPNEDALFLRQYFHHLTGLRPIRYVTCPGFPGEGSGSQAVMIMNAINFAR